jgi:diguanylate cyclase (GGDEF)-like protein
VQRAIDEVEHQVEADLLTNERVYLLGAAVVGANFGFTTAQSSAFLGFDIDARVALVDGAMERLLARLAPDDPLRDRIQQVRATVTTGPAPPGTADALHQVTTASKASGNLSAQALDDAEALFLDGGAGRRLPRLHAIVRTSLDAMNDVGFQLEAAGLIYGTTDPIERVSQLDRLRGATADYEHDRNALQRLTGAAGLTRIRRQWRAIDDDPGVVANAAWLDQLGDSDAASLPDLTPFDLAGPLGVGLGRMKDISELARFGLGQAHHEAAVLRASAVGRLRLHLAATGMLTLATLAVVALIARSIGRPIQDLAAAAERASTGQLDELVLSRGGPPEVRRVSATLNEVIANLRTVEAQVGALAAGSLEDPVLAEPVPGRLGTLLHASVARLSRAMTDQEDLGKRLEHEATHDPLTQLPNRTAARAALSAALQRARRSGTAVAVLFIDLDGFKQVNDTHGHAVGDRVLSVTAERLSDALRGGDMVARIGGDEFVVIAEQVDDTVAMLELGNRLIAEVSAPITIGAIATRISASIGVALALDGGVDPDALLRDADLAAYRAKLEGRGRVEPFDEALRRDVARRIEVEDGLRHAIAHDELELHFQPVVTPDGVTQSVEALVRWRRPDGELIPPGDFIPVAESSDLIIDLDQWVLHEACRHLASWTDDPALGALTVSVNLSGRHLLNLTVIDDVRAALHATGADPTRLVLEITETVLLADLPMVIEHLRELRTLGVQIAIDDFGTGYTSLTHLRSLPVDVVKIDRSMVIAEQPIDAHVLKLLVDTVHALGLGLVAEGVETDAQLDRLNALGCDQIQGFLFCRPVPGGELREAVGRTARPRV